jgi:hypothetical protein
MAEKREIARTVAQLPHLAHTMGASAWLIGRSFSNNAWQSAHRYSYNGIASVLYPAGFEPITELLYNALRVWSRHAFRESLLAV